MRPAGDSRVDVTGDDDVPRSRPDPVRDAVPGQELVYGAIQCLSGARGRDVAMVDGRRCARSNDAHLAIRFWKVTSSSVARRGSALRPSHLCRRRAPATRARRQHGLTPPLHASPRF